MSTAYGSQLSALYWFFGLLGAVIGVVIVAVIWWIVG